MERTTSRHMAVGTGSKRLADALRRIVEGETLERATSRGVMHAILNARSSPAQLAGLLAALATRGVTVEELVGFAEIMRASAEGAPLGPGLMDTCGTGGSGKATVNTSTLVAFILAAAGVKVAKHGNRASSGKCGSADVLEALGIRIDIGPAQAAKMLRETNVAFLYAPRFHPAMRHVMSVRKELGFRTVFNLLGPLCNPANPSRQLLGVSDPAAAPLMADALNELGVERALVVHGCDGLDEFSLCSSTEMFEIRDGRIVRRIFEPEMADLERVPFAAVDGGDVTRNQVLFFDILGGKEVSPRVDAVLLNAGAGLYINDLAPTIREGVDLARAILRSREPMKRFLAYRHLCQLSET
jgi:anthranilate phosphoribosyltransferase